jgi:hypothetical protein
MKLTVGSELIGEKFSFKNWVLDYYGIFSTVSHTRKITNSEGNVKKSLRNFGILMSSKKQLRAHPKWD